MSDTTILEKPSDIFPIPGDRSDPHSLHHLGFEPLAWNEETLTFRAAFQTQSSFRNPGGIIQGGMLAAMLDDTFGPLCIKASNFTQVPLTLDMNTTYLSPGLEGRYECEARIIRRGKSIVFVEGELFGPNGELVARSTSTLKMRARPGA